MSKNGIDTSKIGSTIDASVNLEGTSIVINAGGDGGNGGNGNNGIKIVADDYKKQAKQWKDFVKEYKSGAKQIIDIMSEMRKSGEGLKDFTPLREATRWIDDLDYVETGLTNAFGELKKAMDAFDVGDGVDDLSQLISKDKNIEFAAESVLTLANAFKALGGNFDNLPDEMQSVGNLAKKIEASFKNLNKEFLSLDDMKLAAGIVVELKFDSSQIEEEINSMLGKKLGEALSVHVNIDYDDASSAFESLQIQLKETEELMQRTTGAFEKYQEKIQGVQDKINSSVKKSVTGLGDYQDAIKKLTEYDIDTSRFTIGDDDLNNFQRLEDVYKRLMQLRENAMLASEEKRNAYAQDLMSGKLSRGNLNAYRDQYAILQQTSEMLKYIQERKEKLLTSGGGSGGSLIGVDASGIRKSIQGELSEPFGVEVTVNTDIRKNIQDKIGQEPFTINVEENSADKESETSYSHTVTRERSDGAFITDSQTSTTGVSQTPTTDFTQSAESAKQFNSALTGVASTLRDVGKAAQEAAQNTATMPKVDVIDEEEITLLDKYIEASEKSFKSKSPRADLEKAFNEYSVILQDLDKKYTAEGKLAAYNYYKAFEAALKNHKISDDALDSLTIGDDALYHDLGWGKNRGGTSALEEKLQKLESVSTIGEELKKLQESNVDLSQIFKGEKEFEKLIEIIHRYTEALEYLEIAKNDLGQPNPMDNSIVGTQEDIDEKLAKVERINNELNEFIEKQRQTMSSPSTTTELQSALEAVAQKIEQIGPIVSEDDKTKAIANIQAIEGELQELATTYNLDEQLKDTFAQLTNLRAKAGEVSIGAGVAPGEGSINAEIEKLKGLRDFINNEVILAINNKSDAFDAEETAVQEAVTNEIQYLSSLSSTIDAIIKALEEMRNKPLPAAIMPDVDGFERALVEYLTNLATKINATGKVPIDADTSKLEATVQAYIDTLKEKTDAKYPVTVDTKPFDDRLKEFAEEVKGYAPISVPIAPSQQQLEDAIASLQNKLKEAHYTAYVDVLPSSNKKNETKDASDVVKEQTETLAKQADITIDVGDKAKEASKQVETLTQRFEKLLQVYKQTGDTETFIHQLGDKYSKFTKDELKEIAKQRNITLTSAEQKGKKEPIATKIAESIPTKELSGLGQLRKSAEETLKLMNEIHTAIGNLWKGYTGETANKLLGNLDKLVADVNELENKTINLNVVPDIQDSNLENVINKLRDLLTAKIDQVDDTPVIEPDNLIDEQAFTQKIYRIRDLLDLIKEETNKIKSDPTTSTATLVDKLINMPTDNKGINYIKELQKVMNSFTDAEYKALNFEPDPDGGFKSYTEDINKAVDALQGFNHTIGNLLKGVSKLSDGQLDKVLEKITGINSAFESRLGILQADAKGAADNLAVGFLNYQKRNEEAASAPQDTAKSQTLIEAYTELDRILGSISGHITALLASLQTTVPAALQPTTEALDNLEKDRNITVRVSAETDDDFAATKTKIANLKKPVTTPVGTITDTSEATGKLDLLKTPIEVPVKAVPGDGFTTFAENMAQTFSEAFSAKLETIRQQLSQFSSTLGEGTDNSFMFTEMETLREILSILREDIPRLMAQVYEDETQYVANTVSTNKSLLEKLAGHIRKIDEALDGVTWDREIAIKVTPSVKNLIAGLEAALEKIKNYDINVRVNPINEKDLELITDSLGQIRDSIIDTLPSADGKTPMEENLRNTARLVDELREKYEKLLAVYKQTGNRDDFIKGLASQFTNKQLGEVALAEGLALPGSYLKDKKDINAAKIADIADKNNVAEAGGRMTLSTEAIKATQDYEQLEIKVRSAVGEIQKLRTELNQLVDSQIVSAEIESLRQIVNVLAGEIPKAIDKKDDAFFAEKKVVERVVESEKASLKELEKSIKSVVEAVNFKSAGLEQFTGISRMFESIQDIIGNSSTLKEFVAAIKELVGYVQTLSIVDMGRDNIFTTMNQILQQTENLSRFTEILHATREEIAASIHAAEQANRAVGGGDNSNGGTGGGNNGGGNGNHRNTNSHIPEDLLNNYIRDVNEQVRDSLGEILRITTREVGEQLQSYTVFARNGRITANRPAEADENTQWQYTVNRKPFDVTKQEAWLNAYDAIERYERKLQEAGVTSQEVQNRIADLWEELERAYDDDASLENFRTMSAGTNQMISDLINNSKKLFTENKKAIDDATKAVTEYNEAVARRADDQAIQGAEERMNEALARGGIAYGTLFTAHQRGEISDSQWQETQRSWRNAQTGSAASQEHIRNADARQAEQIYNDSIASLNQLIVLQSKLNELQARDIRNGGKALDTQTERNGAMRDYVQIVARLGDEYEQIEDMYMSGAITDGQLDNYNNLMEQVGQGLGSDSSRGSIEKAVAGQYQKTSEALKKYADALKRVKDYQDMLMNGDAVSGRLRGAIHTLDETKKKTQELIDTLKNINTTTPVGGLQNILDAFDEINGDYGSVRNNDIDIEQGFENPVRGYASLTKGSMKYLQILRKIDNYQQTSLNDDAFMTNLKKHYDDVNKSAKAFAESLGFVVKRQSEVTSEEWDEYKKQVKEIAKARQEYNESISQDMQRMANNALKGVENRLNDLDSKTFEKSGSFKAELDSLSREFRGDEANGIKGIESIVGSADFSSMKLDDFRKLIRLVDELDGKLARLERNTSYNKVNEVQKATLQRKMAEWSANNTAAKEANAEIRELSQTLAKVDDQGTLNEVSVAFERIKREANQAGKVGQAFANQLQQSFKNLVRYMASFASFYNVVNILKQGVNVVKQLDKQYTEMRKVSDASISSLRDYQLASFDLANQVGTTAVQLQASTADWMRLGEELQTASESAQLSNLLLNVSEFSSIDAATDSLVAMSQAFQELEKISIIDKLNNIGNNFSISTNELAESLQKSAGTLKVAGNTIDEAIALTVAGVRTPERYGNMSQRKYLIALIT